MHHVCCERAAPFAGEHVPVAADLRVRVEMNLEFVDQRPRNRERRHSRIGFPRADQLFAVPIDLALGVCVLPEAIRAHVRAALLGVFSNRDNADGTRGLFHPDRLTFGTSIYLSQLIAAAVAVPGVETARADTLERLFEGPNGELEQGILPIGRLEIGRLDSDPDFPEHGRLRLELRGGR